MQACRRGESNSPTLTLMKFSRAVSGVQRTVRFGASLLPAVTSLAAPSNSDWASYLGGEERSHYSTLSQINAGNVANLTQAWVYRAGETRPDGRSEMQCNPLVVGGVMFATLPGAALIALNAATGRELWRFDARTDATERNDARPKSEFITNRNRGGAYWADGDDR